MIRSAIAGLVWTLLGISFLLPGAAQTVPDSAQLASVRYTVSLAQTNQHLVHVRIQLPPGRAERDVQLPVWNALYQVRDFAQYINWVRCRDPLGKPVALVKLDKSRWRITGAGGGVDIEYEIFANQSGPFGAQLTDQHAFFNLAEILMYSVEERASSVQLHFSDVPAAWRIATALTPAAGDFSADNYDQLVDSPVELGEFQEKDFDEGSGHYRVVVDADSSAYNMQQIVSSLQHIVASATIWMDDRPFATYLFIYHFPRGPAGGGMEHSFSTAIDISAERLAENSDSLVDITAHEFFHLWNVKRIRPQTLFPVDYTRENYTTALWFSEGFTTTAASFINLRAGVLDEARFQRVLAGQIGMLQQRPAHLTQSAEESSLDAWLEKYDYYRRPERSISYYNKGFLLGILLDLQIREASHGTASIRDVFQWLNENYAKRGRAFPDSDGIRLAAETVAHSDLKDFFQKYVAGVDEIPWNDFFKTVGLRLVRRTVSAADPGFAVSRNFDATPAVAGVTSGSEAERQGVALGDAILDINGQPAGADVMEKMTLLRPGDTLRLRIRDRQGEREVHWKLGTKEEVEFVFEDMNDLTPSQKARRAAWLKGESQEGSQQGTHP